MTRLADLAPATVGRAATDLVLARLGRLVAPLSPGVMLHLGPVAGDTDLGLTVASLAAWAQGGELGDWEDHEDAADALLTTTEAIYRAPLADAWDAAVAAAEAEDGPEDDPVAVTLAAAWSRLRIARGEAVTLAELARLASVTPGLVKQLVVRGELRAAQTGSGPKPSRVDATEARRWLSARGLRGW